MSTRWMVAVLSLVCVSVLAQETATKAASQPQSQEHRRFGERFQGVGGTISAINNNQITLKTTEGKTVTVNLSADTRYRRDGNPAALTDFKVGDEVIVRADPAGENAWNARFVGTRSNAGAEFREGLGKRFVVGELKSIEGTRLSILRPDGDTQIIEVDENTSFRKQNESITLADFKPGDHVLARGGLKNGTFVAATVSLGGYTYAGPAERRSPDSPNHH